jgi:HAE1 family hydrophobic/amphiphilic exporter-1
MSLSSYAIKRPVTTIATTLAMVLVGAISLARLPVSLLPDVTLPVLTIRTSYPGSAAAEASRLVAEPIEQSIAATPGLVELRSVSRNEEVTTTARFAWGTNMPATVLNVRERLDNIRGQLPEKAERPTLLTSDPGQRPIAMLGLTGPGDLRSISRTAAEVHARRLEQLDGVASVAVVGSPVDEIRVEVDPERIRNLGLSPENIADALRAANWSAPGGTIRRGQFRFSVLALTEFRSVDEIGETPLGQGGTLRLRDVATVSLTTADPRTVVHLEGRPAVGLVVYKDAGSNTVAVTNHLYEAVDALQKEFPDIKLTVVAAQATFVKDALSNLTQEIVAGGILSLLVILLFLRDVRASIAIALIIPLSVLVALVILQALDVTINVLSLGGLALGVGLLVDNAIVVAEATGRYRDEGMPLVQAATVASEEVAGPLIAGTLTTLLVFGPIIFVRGLAAALFRDLSLSVVTSVGASLILALTLMPVMMVGRANSKRSTMSGKPVEKPEGKVMGWLTRMGHHIAEGYESGMEWCLGHSKTVFAVAILSCVVTALIAMRLPREILPQVDEGVVVAAFKLPEGTALDETQRQVARIEAAARNLGATNVFSRIGFATDEEILAGAEPGSSSTAQLIVPVPDNADASTFADRLRRAVPDLAQGALALDLAGQSEFGSLIGREGRLIRVEVSALKQEQAERWADSVRAQLRGLKTLADVRDAFAGTQDVIEVTLERQRIALRGISIEDVIAALSGALGGISATDFRETDRRTPITVRFAGSANEDLNAALATTVGGIPVGELVQIHETRAPIEMVRVNQRPVSVIEAAVEQGGTARASRDVQSVLEQSVTPAGLTWQIAGADIEQRRTTKELSVVAALSIALMFLVLAGEFASFTTPLLIMLTVPLAGAGGIIILWMTGQSLNAVSLIGMVVMIGIADNDAVVKLDAIRRFREQGYPINEAVKLGGRQRLRAIAMTSLTTVVGVLPLVIGLGSGGELYQPLAAGIIGGSISATLVTFFLLPTAYAWVERRKERKALTSPPVPLSINGEGEPMLDGGT